MIDYDYRMLIVALISIAVPAIIVILCTMYDIPFRIINRITNGTWRLPTDEK